MLRQLVHTPNPRAGFTSPYVWAALLLSVLVGGMLLGFLVMRRQQQARGSGSSWLRAYQFHPLALLEAFVAISSGVLLWMGFWDFIDVYLVPREWWAKLCMMLVGALGLFLTRTLYDDQEAYIEAHADAPGEEGPRSPRSAALEMQEGQPRPPPLDRNSSTSSMPPVLGSPVRLSNSPLAARLAAMAGKRDASYRAVASGQAVPSAEDEADVEEDRPRTSAGGEGAAPAAARAQRRYFEAPRFSCARCSRALLAILAGLTLWVGIWDLIDEHVLPAIFTACVKEPNRGCAIVKLSLIGVGALGMFVTRSLYGDKETQQAQFQRFE